MVFTRIIYEKSNGVAKITINRPEVRNALDVKAKEEILEVLNDVEKDGEIKVVVITGAGERAFCAGADLKVFLEMDEDRAWPYLEITKGLVDRIENMQKPVIAAVNGHVMGGGLEIVMACDLAVAVEDALFGQTEINVGLIPGAGGSQRLPRLVGTRKAKEMIFTGKLITAKEAETLGLVNRVVPREELWNAVNEYIEAIMSKSPIILSYAKRAINASYQRSFEEGMIVESKLFAGCFSTRDQKEGVRAFLEKRKPVFKGE